ncbi:MAG: hypothetical protein JW999_06690 [Methanotrichaceae archaeon]|nr:hypothetical protein [Methanotrichaceae archaeon]
MRKRNKAKGRDKLPGRAGRCQDAKWIFILAAVFIYIFISIGFAFELSPANPSPGQDVTLTGTAQPGEELSFQSSFTMNLPVTGGEYKYETTVEVPQKPNRFTVSAKNVQDFNAGVKIGIWITKSFQASGGTARISQADVPPGRYNLKMFGKALPGSTVVPVNVQAQTQVQADPEGKYKLIIDTSGVPSGDYRIQGAGDAKTIRLGDAGSAPTSTLAEANGWNENAASGNKASNSKNGASGTSRSGTDGTLAEKQEAKPVGINRDTVQWYAGETGLEIKNDSQYDEAEKLLKKRLSGGYWKIIAQGQPLTEEAGDCLQKYCLVRGADACTVCREKDIILKSGQPSNYLSSNLSRNKSSLSAVSENQSMPYSGKPERDKSIMSMISDWINGLLSQLFGGL